MISKAQAVEVHSEASRCIPGELKKVSAGNTLEPAAAPGPFVGVRPVPVGGDVIFSTPRCLFEG